MSYPDKATLKQIQFYVTTKYSCSYINNRKAQSIVATPYKRINDKSYDDLITKGFRRSGQYIYKPHCQDCTACIPIRLCVDRFILSKSQKKVNGSLKNSLTIKILPLAFNKDHYALYVHYQNNRHPTQDKSDTNIVDYNDFLIKSHVTSKLIEFRKNGELKIVTIIDIVNNGISAVYTFFDCNENKYSYGTYSILWLLELCKKKQLNYVYLGYWISKNQKMKYKTNFKPYELFINDAWQKSSS